MSLKKESQRTTLPFDGGLSPLTPRTRVVPMWGDTPLISDILNHEVSKNVDVHGRGSWGIGDDVSHSFKEKGDEFMLNLKMEEILKRIENKKENKKEKWIAITVDNKEIEFPSHEIAQKKIRDNNIKYKVLKKVTAQKRNFILQALDSSFEIQSSTNNVKEIGSAFAIRDGLFLTCAHCVSRYDKYNMPSEIPPIDIILLKNGKTYKANLVAIDFSVDAAIVSSNIKCNILDIEEPKNINVGDGVFAVGCPKGFENNVTAGIVSSKNRIVFHYNNAPKFLFTDAQVLPGSSGGALISYNNCKVVGMMALIISDEGLYGLNAAIQSEYLTNFVNRNI